MIVGQKVWYVPQRGYSKYDPGREYHIIKIARKWITMLNAEDHAWSAICVERDQLNASQEGYRAYDRRGDVVGKVYVDRQHESYAADRKAAWDKVERYVSHLHSHVTLKDIKNIALILEVSLDESTGNKQ